MKINNSLVILLCYFPVSFLAICDENCKGRNNPDVLSTVPQIVERHDYKVETFNVTTGDGYILSLFKISKNGKKSKKKPVFLQHGITTASACWVDTGNRSLAFKLVDKGHEVWLGNVRGSHYSQKHKTLTVSDPNFWNFTLDTIAANDMPTQLKFVFKQSGKMMYVGHSMGTTLYLMYSSTFTTEAKRMIKAALFLAPVAYLNDLISIKKIELPGYLLIDFFDANKHKGAFYHKKINILLVEICCCIPDVCKIAIDRIYGKTVQLSFEDIPLFMSNWPDGVSIYQLKQYLQIADSARFQKYDYGPKKNNEVYGTAEPPVYNLKSVTHPIALFYGEHDSLYRKENLERLYSELGSAHKHKYAIPSEGSSESFNHNDFLYSNKNEKNLYRRFFKMFRKFEK